jgi:hypothetical protein
LAFDFKTPWCNGWSDDLNYRRPCAKQKQSLSFCLLIIALFVLLFMSSAYTCCIYTVFFFSNKENHKLDHTIRWTAEVSFLQKGALLACHKRTNVNLIAIECTNARYFSLFVSNWNKKLVRLDIRSDQVVTIR